MNPTSALTTMKRPVTFEWKHNNCLIIATLHGILSLEYIQKKLRELYHQQDTKKVKGIIKKLVYLQRFIDTVPDGLPQYTIIKENNVSNIDELKEKIIEYIFNTNSNISETNKNIYVGEVATAQTKQELEAIMKKLNISIAANTNTNLTSSLCIDCKTLMNEIYNYTGLYEPVLCFDKLKEIINEKLKLSVNSVINAIYNFISLKLAEFEKNEVCKLYETIKSKSEQKSSIDEVIDAINIHNLTASYNERVNISYNNKKLNYEDLLTKIEESMANVEKSKDDYTRNGEEFINLYKSASGHDRDWFCNEVKNYLKKTLNSKHESVAIKNYLKKILNSNHESVEIKNLTDVLLKTLEENNIKINFEKLVFDESKVSKDTDLRTAIELYIATCENNFDIKQEINSMLFNVQIKEKITKSIQNNESVPFGRFLYMIKCISESTASLENIIQNAFKTIIRDYCKRAARDKNVIVKSVYTSGEQCLKIFNDAFKKTCPDVTLMKDTYNSSNTENLNNCKIKTIVETEHYKIIHIDFQTQDKNNFKIVEFEKINNEKFKLSCVVAASGGHGSTYILYDNHWWFIDEIRSSELTNDPLVNMQKLNNIDEITRVEKYKGYFLYYNRDYNK